MSKEISVEDRVAAVIIDRTALGRWFDLSWKLIEDCGADSLDLVEITLTLEEVFEMEIPDEDAEKLITGQDIVDYIKERRRTKLINRTAGGFSLIELLICLAVMGILAAIAVPCYSHFVDKVRGLF